MTNFKKVLLFALGLLLSFMFLELFLIFGEVSSTSGAKQDPILGTALIPNHEFLYFNEGFSIGKVNEYGYYGKGYSKNFKAGVKRIALVGDSYVEGVQVFERNHFRNKLEDFLNKEESAFQYEVLNFGRSGFNLNDAYCYYQNFIKKFNPNIKLIFVSPGDLISENSTNLFKPYVYLDKENNLRIDYSFNKSERYKFKESTSFLRGKSLVFGYLLRTSALIKSGNYKAIIFGKFSNLFQKSNVQNINNFHKKEVLSDLSKKIILTLDKEGFVFVVHSETTNNRYNYLLDDFLKFSSENKIKIIELSTLFKKLKEQGVPYNYWPITKKTGHFNERGHLEIAKFLTNKIKLELK